MLPMLPAITVPVWMPMPWRSSALPAERRTLFLLTAARFGGEEFVILLSETDLAGAEIVAERIRSSIEAHALSYDMQSVSVTASLGVSVLHTNDTADSLVKRADDAMYKAKKKMAKTRLCWPAKEFAIPTTPQKAIPVTNEQ